MRLDNRLLPNPSWRAIIQGRSQKYFSKFLLLPTTPQMAELPNGSEKKICGGSRSAGFGEGTPQQDHHKGENEQ